LFSTPFQVCNFITKQASVKKLNQFGILISMYAQVNSATTRRIAQDWPVITFFALAYFIGWAPMPILAWIANDAGIESWITLSQLAESWSFDNQQLAVPYWLVYVITRIQDFAFSISGLILIGYLYGGHGFKELGKRFIPSRVSGIYWILAGLPIAFYAIATLTAGALTPFDGSGINIRTALFSIESGLLVTLLLRGPMGEELGLRGFALPRLQLTMSPFKASLIIGIFWAAWHFPVLLNRDLLSIIAFLILAFLLSFVFTFLFNGSGGSLLPVLLFHTFQNSEEGFELFFPTLTETDWELVSSLCLLALGLVIGFLLWKNRNKKAETQ